MVAQKLARPAPLPSNSSITRTDWVYLRTALLLTLSWGAVITSWTFRAPRGVFHCIRERLRVPQ
jgi:hypothetical protein